MSDSRCRPSLLLCWLLGGLLLFTVLGGKQLTPDAAVRGTRGPSSESSAIEVAGLDCGSGCVLIRLVPGRCRPDCSIAAHLTTESLHERVPGRCSRVRLLV